MDLVCKFVSIVLLGKLEVQFFFMRIKFAYSYKILAASPMMMCVYKKYSMLLVCRTLMRNIKRTKSGAQSYNRELRAAIYKKDFSAFTETLPLIIKELRSTQICDEILPMVERYKMVLQYNLEGGKKLRAMTLISSYRLLTSNYTKMEEDMPLSYILAWCVELIQAFELVLDDIVDKSRLRRRKLSWFFKNEQQSIVIYDGLMLYESIFVLLKKYFSQKENYKEIIGIFHEVSFRINFAQILDCTMGEKRNYPDREKTQLLDEFTVDTYYKIAINKTSYYTFYLPVVLAMQMAGRTDLQTAEFVKDITLQIGHLMQVQDDFLDSYGDPSVTGKEGTDIAEGKCTWLIITTLQSCDCEQKTILEENYGRNDIHKIAAVKEVFDSVDLKSKYKSYEIDRREQIMKQIETFNDSVIRRILCNILDSIFGRRY